MKTDRMSLCAAVRSGAPRARRRGAHAPARRRARATARLARQARARARVALDEHGARRRPARAPRCRARRCRRTGRARAPVDVVEHREQRLAHAVGGRPRARRPRGAFRRLPPSLPAITRMRATVAASARPRRLAARVGVDRRAQRRRTRAQRVAEQRVLGPAQLRIGRDERLGPRARALEQLGVLGQARAPR